MSKGSCLGILLITEMLCFKLVSGYKEDVLKKMLTDDARRRTTSQKPVKIAYLNHLWTIYD